MTKGIKALNNRGEITLCTAQNPGTGNCNHVLHQFEGTSDFKFQSQVDSYNEKLAEATDMLKEIINESDYEDIEENIGDLEDEGILEIYCAVGKNKKMFELAANNIISKCDKVFVASSEVEMQKKLYDFYREQIEDDIKYKLDNGEYSDYGSVLIEREDRETPEYAEYDISFTYHDIDDLTSGDTVDGLKINVEYVNGKYYAVNVSE